MLTAVSDCFRFGGRPQRHAQPYERTSAVARRYPRASAGLLQEPADHEQPDAVPGGGRLGGAAVGHDHLDLAGHRVGSGRRPRPRRDRRGRPRCRSGSRWPGGAWSGWPRPRPGRRPGRARSPRGPRPRSWPPTAPPRPRRARPRWAPAGGRPAPRRPAGRGRRPRPGAAPASGWGRGPGRGAGRSPRRRPAPRPCAAAARGRAWRRRRAYRCSWPPARASCPARVPADTLLPLQ